MTDKKEPGARRSWLIALWRLQNKCPDCETRGCSVYAAGIDTPFERQSLGMQLMHAAFRR